MKVLILERLSTLRCMRYAPLTLAEAFTPFGGHVCANMVILPTSLSMLNCRSQAPYGFCEQHAHIKSKTPTMGRRWFDNSAATYQNRPKSL
jgi:hypothetical protein